jgi:ribosomal protein S18 acetylase RimI-like enzyme
MVGMGLPAAATATDATLMSDLTIRRARQGDLAAIVALLADDSLGRGREDPSLPLDARYAAAFAAIEADPNQLLAVADRAGQIVACLQVTFIPGLSRRGLWRGQIESVRVASGARGEGLGERMLQWAIGICRERGCGLVQLTTDKSRSDARRFYEKLGFTASHEGMKLALIAV